MTLSRASIRPRPTALPLFLVFAGSLSASLTAQFPSDEEVRKQLWNKDVVAIRFPRQTGGEKIFDRSNRSWYWQRGAVVVRKAKIAEFPEATVEIGGVARYFITGEKVSFQTFKVMWNVYRGIPAPTDAETLAMVTRQKDQLFRGSARRIIGDVESLQIAADPQRVWHTPHSFSVNFTARYRFMVSNTEIEKQTATYRVRFYREDFKSPWRDRFVASRVKFEPGEKTTHTLEEVRAMPTMATLAARRAAEQARAALPKVEVPEFGSEMDVFRFVYKLLRGGDPKALEAGITQFLAPHYYQDEAGRLLNRTGAHLVQTAVKRAYGGASKYPENYGAEFVIKRQQRGQIELWNRSKQVKTRIAVRQFEDPETGAVRWRLTALEPWTLTRRSDILRLRRLAK